MFEFLQLLDFELSFSFPEEFIAELCKYNSMWVSEFDLLLVRMSQCESCHRPIQAGHTLCDKHHEEAYQRMVGA